ncbi:MAG: thiol:disulfide interchange protein DsbA/DsbL [Giesbergeria sp.]|nr:thiol:disulfide interchange protein DsbA/DsbL [Giesbergeria sp.]MBP7916765.1 thiol:disulfide interchange protein DsbA/DsbL [Giesbergeria sp.]MBP8840678.1 thiol:disulfide interchange protein DsbA/DsbL [Giesbergeria sp.]
MKRRDFSVTAASLAAAAAGSALGLPALAQGAPFKEGKDYAKLAKPVASTAAAGKVEVVEFFWYSCAHCNAFEPVLATWMKSTASKNASVQRVPVAFNASFAAQQKLYYALEGMGKVDELHARVFRAIHVERQNLSKEDGILAWMGKQPGVDMVKFKEVYNSFSVASQVRRATQLQEAYGVEGVPSMGVAGRYYTDGTMAGSMPSVLAVVNHLIGISSAKA